MYVIMKVIRVNIFETQCIFFAVVRSQCRRKRTFGNHALWNHPVLWVFAVLSVITLVIGPIFLHQNTLAACL